MRLAARWIVVWVSLLAAPGALAETTPGKFTGGVKYDIPEWFKDSFLELADDAAEAAAADRHAMWFIHAPE